jgi:gamma-glutamylcyclotransferase (GGCT)/AIG2-like uncharacterized protein YtfP
MTQYLFSYGTLQLPKVQKETYARLLVGRKDILPQYKLDEIEITNIEVLKKSNKKFHPIAVRGSELDFIEGVIFEITEQELLETDKYEVSGYIRVLEEFMSGQKAWVYVSKRLFKKP